jgi:glutaredoxin-dependent peroxiredoxin
MSLKIGDKAPDFSLLDTDKNRVSLQNYDGKNLVILFFPMAFTSVCTAELCDMRDSMAAYGKLDADVVAISVDSPFTLGKFKELENLNFPLLSDFNKEASQAYQSYYDEFVLGLKGVSKRSAFVVDKSGVIRYAEVLDIAKDIPNFAAIKETLSQL